MTRRFCRIAATRTIGAIEISEMAQMFHQFVPCSPYWIAIMIGNVVARFDVRITA